MREDLPYTREDLKDSKGACLTQGLFYEFRNDPKFALFTVQDHDREVKGKKLISLKKRFLEARDTVGYLFAIDYLDSWYHWNRLKENQWINNHIKTWEEELELMLMAEGIQGMVALAEEGNSFQANNFLVKRGWRERTAGRPSKEEQVKQEKLEEKLKDEFSSDVARLRSV